MDLAVFVILLIFILVALSAANTSEMLFEAVKSNKPDVIDNLLSKEKQLLNTQDQVGQTPLMAAVMAGSLEAADMLLKLGADPLIGEVDGYTPMHAAAFQGNLSFVQCVLQLLFYKHRLIFLFRMA
jgi:ankyrin repeat protein